MFHMKILSVFLCIISVGLAIRRCSWPQRYYGMYLNSRLAVECPNGGTEQCVSAVFYLCKAPHSDFWKRGKHVTTYCEHLPRNTAIASFTSNYGRSYDGRTGGHAAIFLYCMPNGDIRVADQWCEHSLSERTLYKDCHTDRPNSDCADRFFTVEWNSN